MAGVQEIQELKRVAEMRSQLRTVSEAGVGGGLSGAEPRRGGGQWSSQASHQSLELRTPRGAAFVSPSWLRSSPDVPTTSQKPR